MAKSYRPISSWIRLTVFGLFLPLFVLAFILYVAMNAAALQAAEIGPADSVPTASAAVDEASPAALVDSWSRFGAGRSFVKSPAAAEVITPTTLSVTILSTPWAVLDSNKPGETDAPNAFAVEARVLNTGDYDAVDLELVLDYNEDPANDWLLLEGEDLLRTPAGNLAPGEEFYGYWFATYPITSGAGHQYTVTASAELVDPVSTSANFFFEPALGATVVTTDFLSTGSSGQSSIETDIVVGVAYTITVEYNLGANPRFLIFTPVGNPWFDAGSTRLLGSSVRLFNPGDITGTTFTDRLFIPNVPTMTNDLPPDTAEMVYTMLPVTPASTELCPFMAVGDYSAKPRFDQFYCSDSHNTSVIIEGDLSYSMTKSVDSDLVQQNGVLTYTIDYTNTGTLALNQIWVWDDLDPAVASVISGTVSPAPDPAASNEHRVAWFLGTIPPLGEPGYTGTLTFQALVDGGGADLADGSAAPNHAFFGVNPGSLPPQPAFTATVTSAVQAPSIALAKSDGLENIGNGQTLTYTVTAANNGSVTASSVVLTDVLPALVDLAGTPSPAPDDVQGQTLVWTSLADLAPGETLTVTIPVTVSQDAPSFANLLNQAYFRYDNDLSYTFDVETASDTTEVARVAGYVEGYAFEDTVPDGTFDGDEPRLSGVQITLPAALTPTVTTDVDGYYRFRIEVEEPISVTAGLPAGYFRTTPGKAFLDSTFDVTKTVNFGYASTSSDFAVLYGSVYADHNHDGVQDLGESGLPGVTISATAAMTSPVFSNNVGFYTLGFDDSGAVSVEETNPAGYVSTTPDLVQTNVVTGSNQGSPVNFGDFLGIRIEGKVFDDANASGQDDGESGLTGAGVAAGGDSMTTDSSGLYALFARVAGGSIVITETDPAGYVSTNAITGTGMSRVDANTLRIDSPVTGTVYSGGLFGDVLASSVISITGVVWDDNGAGGGAMANGQRDGTEPGLAGVWLSASSGMPAQSQSDGSFALYAPPGVPITVTEQNPAGYVSTNAVPGNNAQKIDHDNQRIEGLSAGQSSAGNQFGDVLSTTVAAFSGTVWNDNGANGGVAADGVWQEGKEPPLAGALVSLSSGMNMPTGSDGAYLLYGPPGAPITITELNPAGYFSTGSIPGVGATRHDDDNLVVASPVANQGYSGNLFGDVLPADLAIAKAAAPDPVPAGGVVTYTLSYENLGPADAVNVTIVDTLSEDVIFLEVVDENPPLDGPVQDGQVLTWTLASLANGGSGTITFTVQVDLDVIGAVSNEATISSDTFDSDGENNVDQTETTVGDPNKATIYGYVYEDLNINGVKDDEELGLSGVTVWLDQGDPGAQSTTTKDDGLFFFITTISGTHKVTEVDPDGYFSTTPNKRVLAVKLGNSKRVDFGDSNAEDAAAIYGTVFDDADSSGTWEDDEFGLTGVTVTLNSATSTLTDLYGGYTFSVTITGTHTVVQTDLPDYFSTTPNTVDVEVDFGNGYETNFGDVLAINATCDPDQFEDDDDYLSANELAFGAKQRHDFCDDAGDWTKFEAKAGSIYTITTSSFDRRTDTYIALYDVDGQTLLAANDDLEGATDFSSQLTFRASANDDYYVRTSNMGGVTGRHTEYDIRVTERPISFVYIPVIITSDPAKTSNLEKPFRGEADVVDMVFPDPGGLDGPLGVIKHECEDDYEVDDTWQTAAPVDHGDVQVHSFDSDPILWAADKDYLGFTLRSDQSITFTVTTVTNTLTVLEAFDRHGRSLGLTGTDQLVFTAPSAGQFYVSVSPQNSENYGCSDEVGYEITVEKSPRWVVFLPIIIKPN